MPFLKSEKGIFYYMPYHIYYMPNIFLYRLM